MRSLRTANSFTSRNISSAPPARTLMLYHYSDGFPPSQGTRPQLAISAPFSSPHSFPPRSLAFCLLPSALCLPLSAFCPLLSAFSPLLFPLAGVIPPALFTLSPEGSAAEGNPVAPFAN